MIERNPIMRMLLLLWAGCLAIGVHGASVSWNCFDVVPGYTPHIVCTAEGFTAIDFAVDNYGESGWQVVSHSSSYKKLYVQTVAEGTAIKDGTVPQEYTATGTGDSIYVAFSWDGDHSGRNGYYGWILLSTDNGNLVVESSALSMERGAAVTAGETIPEPSGGMLMLFGVAVLALRRRKSRQNV